tara:strand:- start:90 stop:320 length:231 start_codon:yes stop_codon:yes gene_type:complete
MWDEQCLAPRYTSAGSPFEFLSLASVDFGAEGSSRRSSTFRFEYNAIPIMMANVTIAKAPVKIVQSIVSLPLIAYG